MSIQVKTFTTKITDEFGGDYPQAFVAIHEASESSQNTLVSSTGEGNYEVEQLVAKVAYKLRYWYSQATKAKGFRSRPLMIDNGSGGFTDVIEVDLDNPQVDQILNSSGEINDKILRIIEADAKRRFR